MKYKEDTDTYTDTDREGRREVIACMHTVHIHTYRTYVRRKTKERERDNNNALLPQIFGDENPIQFAKIRNLFMVHRHDNN